MTASMVPPARQLMAGFLRQRMAALTLTTPRLVHTAIPARTAAPLTPQASTQPSEPTWKPTSQRVGLIAIKRGMTCFFLPNGDRIPCTVMQVHTNQISSQIGFSDPSSTYTALQVAAVSTRHATKQIMGHLSKSTIHVGKKIIREFRVSKDAAVPLGTTLSAMHFVPGQMVDVRGITRGHGFQGVMKRHGFHGLSASHGVSISHRSGGSYGANQDPGRVWPGKKSPGRMGGNKHGSIHNLLVVRVDSSKNLVYLKGNVPGPDGAPITIQDARRPNYKAQRIFRRGRLATGEALTGKEPDAIYLATGVDKLPFPAGTDQLARKLPKVVEIGLSQAQSS